MNEIQLHRIDLNLLVTFEALMEESTLAAAADRLAVTPSAVSHALGRLQDAAQRSACWCGSAGGCSRAPTRSN